MSAENTEVSDGLVEHVYNGKTIRIYPEVAEFFKVMDGARRELDIAYAKADAAWNSAMYADKIKYLEDGNEPAAYDERGRNPEAWRIRRETRDSAETKYYDLVESSRILPENRRGGGNSNAWADLLAKTTHKEVKWILENTVASQPHEAQIMLHYLPNSAEKLWEYGKDDHDFCQVFDQFYSQAEAAGLFSDSDKVHMAGMKEFRALQSYVRRELYSDTSRRVIRDMGKIIAAVHKAHEDALAEAKAEWQGLDEARRSEGARKAAVTRAANREAEAFAADVAEAGAQVKDLLGRVDEVEDNVEDNTGETDFSDYTEEERTALVSVNGNHPDVVMENDAVVTPQPKASEGCEICATQPDRIHMHADGHTDGRRSHESLAADSEELVF